MDWDWIEDFKIKFNRYDELKMIKRDKKHCKVIINFSDGQPHSCKIERNLLAKGVNLHDNSEPLGLR